MAKLDIKSLIYGVLLSLVAQGIYDSVFYFQTGQKLEGFVATTLALIVASIILLISAIVLDFSIHERPKKKKDGTEIKDVIVPIRIHNSKKSDLEKYTLVISIIGLIISSSLTGAIAIQGFDLTGQSNRIAEKSLNLQNAELNYSAIIVAHQERFGVFLNDGGWYLNGTTPPIYSLGTYNGSLTVDTPRTGIVSVQVENFTVQDYDSMLLPNTLNSTTVHVDQYYQYINHDLFVDKGLQTIDFSIPLSTYTYPNPEKLRYGSEPNIFIIGILFLNATLKDNQNINTTIEFSQRINVVIKTTVSQGQ